MADISNPSDIAREALRQLAMRRTPPTPDNYRALYFQIAGQSDAASETFPERQVRTLIGALPRKTLEQRRLATQLERALQQKNWAVLQQSVAEFAGARDSAGSWKELVPALMRQWETRHAGLTPARKRELLEHVIASSDAPDALLARLTALVKSWAQTPVAAGTDHDDADADKPEKTSRRKGGALGVSGEAFDELRELFAFSLESAISALSADDEQLTAEGKRLAEHIRAARSPEAIPSVATEMKRFAYRIELLGEDRNETHTGVLHLLQLLIENISELVVDDTWLHGQIEIVRELVTVPMNLRSIDDAERRLKEIIYRQSALKQSLHEAQEALKNMLAGFVERLADFAESTSDYHDKIESCAKKISSAANIHDLESVIQEVMQETRVIQLNAQRSRDELRTARLRVEEAEKRIQSLQEELGKTSELVRHDQLTGVLNRRGMEEVLAKELARARRRETMLCLGVLDVDNFKKLNDTHGHQAGDAALVHLARVIRGALRPQDTVARYGGEEFLIIMPETELEDARLALVRLQRELTKKYFLHDNQKLLITFSAGITALSADGTTEEAIKRADELMYQAKRSGKNKVIAS